MILAHVLEGCASPASGDIDEQLRLRARAAVIELLRDPRGEFPAPVGNLSASGVLTVCGTLRRAGGSASYAVSFAGPSPIVVVIDDRAADSEWSRYREKCNREAFERYDAVRQADPAALLALLEA